MKLTVLFPLALSIVGFVLTILSLFAGHQKGYMEDYDIIRVRSKQTGPVSHS